MRIVRSKKLLLAFGLLLLVLGGVVVYRYRRDSQLKHVCKGNLMMIGLAMHEYHSRYGCFPPRYTVDENGRPLHSWRALLLPFLGEDYAHKRIDFTIPWDDPENLRTYDRPISVYQCPACQYTGTECSYVAVAGNSACLARGKGTPRFKISDNPIMIIESKRGVSHWASIEDLDSDQDAELNQVLPSRSNRPHNSGLHVLCCDGNVELLGNDLSASNLRSRMQIIDPAFSSTNIIKEFRKQGKPFKMFTFSNPEEPSQSIEIEGKVTDLSKANFGELSNLFEQAVQLGDVAEARSIAVYLCKLDRSGWMGLARANTRIGDYGLAAYWIQQGVIGKGIPTVQYRQIEPLLAQLPKHGDFKYLASFVDATKEFWNSAEPRKERVFQPQDLPADQNNSLLVLLHPAFSSQDFFDDVLCQSIAEDFKITVLTLDGTESIGENSYVWSEDVENFFRADVKRIDSSIERLILEQKINRPSKRILAGAFGGGFTAVLVGMLRPEEYSGAIAICPSIHVAGRMPAFSLKVKDANKSQKYYFWYTPEQRGISEFLADRALKGGPETRSLFSQEPIGFTGQTRLAEEQVKQLLEGLNWLQETP